MFRGSQPQVPVAEVRTARGASIRGLLRGTQLDIECWPAWICVLIQQGHPYVLLNVLIYQW